MELKTLATFRTAAATLSFTQTAAALGYAQSSVTAQVQQLERELGVPLFDRIGNRLTLTEAGQRLLGYADRLLALAEEARAAVSTADPVGTLSISGPETIVTYLLPAILAEFRQRHPTVRVRCIPVPVGELKRRVLDGQLDAAFVLEEPVQSGTLHVTQLQPEPLVLVVAPGHPLAKRGRVQARDLAGELMLFTETGCPYRNKLERALHAAHAHRGQTAQEFSSVEAIKRHAAAGLGIAALPSVAVESERKSGTLAVLAWDGPELTVHTQIVWNATRWTSPALSAFVETVKARPWQAAASRNPEL